MDGLAQKANEMSCAAMIELAKQEWHDNRAGLGYALASRCYDQFDEGALRGKDLSRQLCFTHDPAFKLGDYFKQLGDPRVEKYEEWTRRKDLAPPYPVDPNAMYDLDWEFFNCHKQTPPGKCIYNDGNSVKVVACPPKCGVHPTPCPNPYRL